MGRSPCCEKTYTNKGAWTKEEDQLLLNYIRAHGQGSWRSLPKAAGLLRCGKSCRLRWINYLRPDLKRGNFMEEEVQIIIKLHSLLGNRWSLIAGRLPGRTDNEIKNYWNTHIKRKLISSGIDPQTHRPFNSTLPPSMNDPTKYIRIRTRDNSNSVHHESKCNSSTTEESHPWPPPAHSLDLGLSIGLRPFQSKYRKIASFNSSSSAESKSEETPFEAEETTMYVPMLAIGFSESSVALLHNNCQSCNG